MEVRMDSEGYGRALGPLMPAAHGYALSIVRHRADAQDAVQQAALRGLERISTYDVSRPFKGWWFAVLRNCCIDALRRKGNDALPLDEVDPAEPEPPAAGQWEPLAQALARVSDAHREILRLRYFGGLSYRELAEALEIPPGTVMSRLHAARGELRKEMEAEEQ